MSLVPYLGDSRAIVTSPTINQARLQLLSSFLDYFSLLYLDQLNTRAEVGRYERFVLLTLSAHAREGYSSHFVCLSVSQSVSQSVTFLFWRRRHFQG